MKASFKKKLMRSMLKLVGCMKRMGDEKLANRADAQKMVRKRR